MDYPVLLIVIIALAFVFDYINGFHDAANSIATIVSTKVLSPFQAVLWAAFFNGIAYFIFKDHAVANTVGKTVFKEYINLHVILAGLVAAIVWNLVTWWYGIPSSSSHTLIGGFAGAAVTNAFYVAYVKGVPLPPLATIIDSAKVWQIVMFIFLAPLVGMLISMIFTFITIHRNIYVKSAWLLAICGGIWFGFSVFEGNKRSENLAKYFKVDKYKHEVEKNDLQIKSLASDSKNDAKIDELREKLADQSKKLDDAKANAKKAASHADKYSEAGSEAVVANIMKDTANIDLSKIEFSRLADKLSIFLEIDKKKGKADQDKSYKPTYEATKEFYEKTLKPECKKLKALGFDALTQSLYQQIVEANLLDVSSKSIADFRKAVKVDLQKDLVKEIEKADNKNLRIALMSIMVLFMVTFIYNHNRKDQSALKTASMLKKLQLVSSAAFSIGHGGNDAQKVMGIITAALICSGQIADFKQMPEWVPWTCYLAIGLGTLSGGWKIIKTMGSKITKVTPLEGVCAETAGATTLFLTEQMGIPVSTTHTITGSIIGVGATKRLSAVRWGVTLSLLWAWILTIPISAILAAICYLVCNYFI
jgi:inorganic phosphate transporter, PiT family